MHSFQNIFMPGISERAYSCRTGIKWIVWVNSMNFNALEKNVVWQNLCMKSLEEFFREKSQFLFAFLKTWIKESLHRIINLPSPWNFSSFGIINISMLSPYFLNSWEKKTKNFYYWPWLTFSFWLLFVLLLKT